MNGKSSTTNEKYINLLNISKNMNVSFYCHVTILCEEVSRIDAKKKR